jgi:hypothetical protein
MVRFPTNALLGTLVTLGFVALVGVFPTHSLAATPLSGQTVSVSSSTPDNTYIAAGQVNVNAALPADLCAVGGTVVINAPIGGDALLAGGTVELLKPVLGDARLAGGRVVVNDSIKGDLIAGGGFVTVAGRAKNTLIGAGTIDMQNGSDGPVTLYGADITLAGEFNGDVEVVASDHLTIAEGTIIHGALKYNAPQQADIPSSASIAQGVTYIGSAAYLPTVKQAKTYALAGLWVFFLVQLAAALVVTGLVVGLFPLFTDRLIESALTRSLERFILLALLGFAGFVAVPVLIILLVVSFVGIGIAILLVAAYALFLFLAYIYAAVYAGSIFIHLIRKRRGVSSWHISWRGAIIGVLALHLLGLIPYVGTIVKTVLVATAGGALLSLFYRSAFRHRWNALEEIEKHI